MGIGNRIQNSNNVIYKTFNFTSWKFISLKFVVLIFLQLRVFDLEQMLSKLDLRLYFSSGLKLGLRKLAEVFIYFQSLHHGKTPR